MRSISATVLLEQKHSKLLADKIEQNSELLASHRMVKELTKSRRHACPQCDYKTGNVSHLRKHVRTVHEQRRDHACPQCHAAFGRAGDLTVHVRTVHDQRKDHACPQCDAAFGVASMQKLCHACRTGSRSSRIARASPRVATHLSSPGAGRACEV